VLRAFAERAKGEGIRAATALETGVPARVLLARLRGADAVFLGRQGRGGAADVGPTVRAVGRESVRPVFVACRGVREVKRILVAWDGTHEAMRALRVACELADRGRAGFSYVLLTVSDDRAAGEAVQRDAATYFGGHGIEPERIVRGGAAAATILGCAREQGCDLIVAGSFGQNRLREMVFGSVTYDLLKACEIPLLIHH
jgi:nucleotide-binding universal stress UspA family protein